MSERTYGGFTVVELRGFQENLRRISSKSGAERALGDLLNRIEQLEGDGCTSPHCGELIAVLHAADVTKGARIATLEAALRKARLDPTMPLPWRSQVEVHNAKIDDALTQPVAIPGTTSGAHVGSTY